VTAEQGQRPNPMKEKLTLGIGLALVLLLTIALWYWCSFGGRAAALARSSDPEDRLQAIRELRGKSSSLALNTLRRLTRDGHVRVATQAVQALGDAGCERASDILLEVLDSKASGRVRGEAAASLGMHKTTDVHLLGRKLQEDPDADVRAGAATGIARLRDPAALKYLVAALEDDANGPRVKTLAILAIQKAIVVRFRYDVHADAPTRRTQLDFIKQSLKKAKML
jgi:HEAT repeat protein